MIGTPRALGALLLTALAFALDRWAWGHLSMPDVYDHDWGRLLRVTGSIFPWLALSLALWLEARGWDGAKARRAWLVLAAPVAGGFASEVLKLIVRRERPGLTDGAWVFRPFGDRLFEAKELGLPSGHAMVAFAGAAMLSRLYPRAAPVVWALAIGCGLTRVLARAHFLSDVAVAALISWLVVAGIWRLATRRGPTVASA